MSATTRSALLLALAIFGLALALRLVGIDSRDPWLDEVYSQFAISRGWYDLAADRISRGHSPLYFALMKAFGIAPDNIVGLRIPPAIFDSLGAAILAGAAAIYVGRREAVLFGLLYAFSPVAIHWSQNARPYGLLMLAIGIGLAGAMGLMATLGREVEDDAPEVRHPHRVFAVGFSLAALTITAGIISFVVTAVAPFLLPRTRTDKAFMARWRKALKVPGIVSVLAYLGISGPHVARQMDGYWAEKYNSLGIDGLSNLWTNLIADGARSSTLVKGWLGVPGYTALLWAMSLVLLWSIWCGLRASRSRPALLAPAILALGYTGLLIALSAWTSLLVTRYFLPPLMALLVLAGAGMGVLAQRKWPLLIIVPFLLVHGYFGLHQSLMPAKEWKRDLQPVVEITGRIPQETMRLLYQSKEGTRAKVIMETFTQRFDRPDLERPSLGSFSVADLKEAISRKPDVFAYLTAKRWQDVGAEGIPAPACQHGFGEWVLLYWGEKEAACQ